jgi:hypothetical protein
MFRTRFVKWWPVAIAGALTVAAPVGLRASPLKNPKRLVNGQTVDLTPLFRWWTKQDGKRPLKAWAHLTGPVVGTNAWGWVIEAHIDTALPDAADDTDFPKDQKIILKHPPAAELAEFEKLSADLKDLEAQHAKLSAGAAKATKQGQDAASQEAAANISARKAARLQQQARQSGETAREDDDQLKTIDQQLKEVKDKLATFPSATKYSLDMFALDLRQQLGGMPVFEAGSVWQ